MRRVLIVLSGAVLGTTLLVSPSLGVRHEPGKAGKYQATLVTAYKQCTAVNDTTNGALPLPACHPAIADDDTCFITSDGSGKVSAKVDKAGDVALKLQVKGIDPGCDGDKLVGVASLRVTTNQCTSADPDGCTVVDLTNFPVTTTGSCLLDGGKCKIKTTVNTELGAGTVSNGHQTNLSIFGTALRRTTGAGTIPANLVNAGELLP